ncbi:ARM repeat-containing protein [Morchella conica CCBAS932]|uniref:ARM repeat-containing protein n=1 Tax=Morchella conica CCBAS932 TaxID=1392247 RepID=A0A3N4KXH1_9PEZI|nr:ARM repeat-containing protein [Morchella conica CCBAS932]
MSSQLPPQVMLALQQLLQGLASSDNATRTQAEESLGKEWIAKSPEMLLSGLAEQVRVADDPAARAFAAVLFRRIAAKTRTEGSQPQEMYLTLPSNVMVYIRELLLQCFADETEKSSRNKIGDAVAEVARQLTDANVAWPELLNVLFQASKLPDPSHREGAFRIFATTPGIIEKQHGELVNGVFVAGFEDDNLSVRIAAMEAFSAFFRSIRKAAQKGFYPLLTHILNVLPPIKDAQDTENLSRALMALIDLAELAPLMFKPLFNNVVKFGISVVQDKDLGDQARQNALELLATFADNAPIMCKKDPIYTSEMVTQCLSLMTDIGNDDDDASEWNESDDLDMDESDLNHVAGEQCMDRLANKLGGSVLLAPTFQWLPRMMTSSAWRDRHAALMAISAISEGCRDMMEQELDKILDLVVPALRDAHPRVRWAGCNALGQMSTDFAGPMQEKHHQVVLSNIIPVLESPEPRVQSHAAAALVNFCEEAEKEILEPYLDELLRCLLALLTNDQKRYVQEQALSTIATIADSAEAAFSRYYDTLMPLLFNVLNRPQDPESKDLRLLNAKAMECATLIALAVGRERLGDDAIQLVQVLGRIQQNVTDPDDPQGSYLLHCWGRMCRVMGNDFLPYLTAVMPPLLELASAKANVQLLDDDEHIAQVEQEEGWELLPVRGKYIGIKTSALDDKYMAIELLVIYAQQLEAAFEPYVNTVMTNIALPGLGFFFNDAVRVASARCVPQLLNSIKKAHGPSSRQLAEIWQPAVHKILEVLNSEPAVETLAELYQCFYESVEVVGRGCLTQELMATFIERAENALIEYQGRVVGRLEEQSKPEEEREDTEEMLYAIEDDQTLISDMNKAFHTVFKNQGVSFLPQWERLLPYYDAFITNADPTQRQWALCMMDDVLEFCGPEAWKYQAHFVQPLIDGLSDNIPANRQAAAYGVGIAAKNGGPLFSDFVAATIPKLFEVTQHPQARSDDHVFATENACASIAKILHFNNNKVADVQAVVQAWVSTLPIVNDDEAAPFAYTFLAELIDQKNPAVMNQVPQIFDSVLQALDAETIQGQTAERVVAVTKNLFSTAGVSISQILGSMPVERHNAARRYFA